PRDEPRGTPGRVDAGCGEAWPPTVVIIAPVASMRATGTRPASDKLGHETEDPQRLARGRGRMSWISPRRCSEVQSFRWLCRPRYVIAMEQAPFSDNLPGERYEAGSSGSDALRGCPNQVG